jgi:hypothetical protein
LYAIVTSIVDGGRSARTVHVRSDLIGKVVKFDGDQSASDRQARLAHAQEGMQQRRVEARAGQVSMANDPAERIRIWEEFHGLRLPRNPTHKLSRVIATATDLQLEQVREVRRQRQPAAPQGSVSAENRQQ